MRVVLGLVLIVGGFVALFTFPIGTIIGVLLIFGGFKVLSKK